MTDAAESLSVWHAGERAVQARAGVADRLAAYGPRVLRASMPEQHRSFFAQLPFLLVGSVDEQGRPWASLLAGAPGFARSPDPRSLRVAALPAAADPLAQALQPGAALGMLGIELWTRRRNRVNGHVAARDDRGFTLRVDQSFGNCPQYIQKRDWLGPMRDGPLPPPRAEPIAALDAAAALIAEADTAFIASAAAPVEGRFEAIDVSHRGGVSGFLRRDPGGAILLPDYRGNSFFNTYGNLYSYPRIGLLLVDFACGDLLQLTGRAEIVWDGPEVAALPGAQRLCRIFVEAGQWLRGGFPFRTIFREFSPQALAAPGFADSQSVMQRSLGA